MTDTRLSHCQWEYPFNLIPFFLGRRTAPYLEIWLGSLCPFRSTQKWRTATKPASPPVPSSPVPQTTPSACGTPRAPACMAPPCTAISSAMWALRPQGPALYPSAFMPSRERGPRPWSSSSDWTGPLSQRLILSSNPLPLQLYWLRPTLPISSLHLLHQDLIKIIYVDGNTQALLDTELPGGDKADGSLMDPRVGIRSVCISPNGQHLASGDRMGTLR